MKSWLALVLVGHIWAADDGALRTSLPQTQAAKNGSQSKSLSPAQTTAQSCSASASGSGNASGGSLDTPQLTLSYSASRGTISAGGNITLILDMEVKPRTHIYAPGVEHYTPIEWQMAESSLWATHPVQFPASRMANLPAIGETVPVYDGHIRLFRDITISQDAARTLGSSRCLTVTGSFRYQACDDKLCYFPKTLPLAWTFQNDGPR